MNVGTKALLVEEGSKLLSNALRMAISRPRKATSPQEITETQSSTEETTMPIAEEPITLTPEHYKPVTTKTSEEELGYRWECCMKHLGGANVLLREAYERAIDEGMGDGTAEKIMETMNEHSGMEADLEKMLNIPEAVDEAERLLSGVRAFRKAAWEAKLPTGGGVKDDVADARLWNDLLYQEAFAHAKAQPGTECIIEGM